MILFLYKLDIIFSLQLVTPDKRGIVRVFCIVTSKDHW